MTMNEAVKQLCGEKIVAMEGYSVYNQNINIGAREDLR